MREQKQLAELFGEIFKRKSFHLFRDSLTLGVEDLEYVKKVIDEVIPLDPTIHTEIVLVDKSIRGSQYSIYFYSEKKNDFLQNIGYIGEQIDLALVKNNIGTLWYGIGRENKVSQNGYPFVIMMGISKMKSSSFRKDMFKSKRKAIEEIWSGDEMELANVVRFAPSACNTQPWEVDKEDNTLLVSRVWPKSRGIIPKSQVSFFNRIDIGIFLLFLEVNLCHGGFSYDRELFVDEDDYGDRIRYAKYKISC